MLDENLENPCMQTLVVFISHRNAGFLKRIANKRINIDKKSSTTLLTNFLSMQLSRKYPSATRQQITVYSVCS